MVPQEVYVVVNIYLQDVQEVGAEVAHGMGRVGRLLPIIMMTTL